jgi:hypothetical protein
MADRLEADTWCEECGEIGWEGVCPACESFALAPTTHPAFREEEQPPRAAAA